MKKLTLIIICSIILAILLTIYLVFMYKAEAQDKNKLTIDNIDIPVPEEDMLKIGDTTYYFTCKKDSDCIPMILHYEDITAPLCTNITTKAEKWTSIPTKCECRTNKCVVKLR